MKRFCPECGKSFEATKGATFCCPEHQKSYYRTKKRDLCKHCDECKTFVYEADDKSFTYCKGNKKVIEDNKWTIVEKGGHFYVFPVNPIDGKFSTLDSLLRERGKNPVYHKKGELDFQAKNLYEKYHNFPITHRATPFPGVIYLSPNKRRHTGRPWMVFLPQDGEMTFIQDFSSKFEAVKLAYKILQEQGEDIDKSSPEYKLFKRRLWVDETVKKAYNNNFEYFVNTFIGAVKEAYKGRNEEKEWYMESVREVLKGMDREEIIDKLYDIL